MTGYSVIAQTNVIPTTYAVMYTAEGMRGFYLVGGFKTPDAAWAAIPDRTKPPGEEPNVSFFRDDFAGKTPAFLRGEPAWSRPKPGADRPVVVCLCGSTRFWRTFQRAGLAETMAGRIVLSIGAASGTDDEHFGNLPRDEYDRIKEMLDNLHLRKIDLCDEILVLNEEGYVGVSTAREIVYAIRCGKRVRWLNDYLAPACRALVQVKADREGIGAEVKDVLDAVRYTGPAVPFALCPDAPPTTDERSA